MNLTEKEHLQNTIKTQAKQLTQEREERKYLIDFKKLVEKALCNGSPCDFDSLTVTQLKSMNDGVNLVVDALNDMILTNIN